MLLLTAAPLLCLTLASEAPQAPSEPAADAAGDEQPAAWSCGNPGTGSAGPSRGSNRCLLQSKHAVGSELKELVEHLKEGVDPEAASDGTVQDLPLTGAVAYDEEVENDDSAGGGHPTRHEETPTQEKVGLVQAPARAAVDEQSSSDDGATHELDGLATEFAANWTADRARMVTQEATKMANQLVKKMLVLKQESTKFVSSGGQGSEGASTIVLILIPVCLCLIMTWFLRPDVSEMDGPLRGWRSRDLGANRSPARRQNDSLVASSSMVPYPQQTRGTAKGERPSLPSTSTRAASDTKEGQATTGRPSVDTLAATGNKADMKSILKKALCPGLVVPRCSECLLAVPTLQSCGIPPQQEVCFVVRDLHGMQVLRCEVRKPNWDDGERCTMLVLRAVSPRFQGDEPPVLGYCQAGPFLGEQRSVMIQDAKREAFASLVQDPGRPFYALSYVTGGPMVLFEGNFAANAVNVMDESQTVLADTMPSQVNFDSSRTYYKLRAASRVDVGLLLCCLISIQLMEMK